MPENVQPNAGGEQTPTGEGQGESGSGGLYDLASVPEELRPYVEPHLKAMEANATKKFQEHAEYRKGWEPFEQMGLSRYNPEQVQQLLAFAEMAQDPEKFGAWWREVGERQGLLDSLRDELGPDDDIDLDLDDEPEFSPEQIKQMVAEAVAENLAPVQQQQQEQEAAAFISAQLNTLKEEHGDDLDTDAILQLGLAYVDEDPQNAISRGFADYQRLVGKGEASLFEDKSNQPPAPEGPGTASTAPKPITSFEDARAAGLQMLKEANAAS